MKIKTLMRYDFTHLKRKKLKKLSICFCWGTMGTLTAGEGINWYNCFGEQFDITQ